MPPAFPAPSPPGAAAPPHRRAVDALPMSGAGRRGLATVRVLESLGDCLNGVPAAEAELARSRCLARMIVLPVGAWIAPTDPVRHAGWIGLLILDGLLTRTVEVNGLRAQELLGPGDVLRPWDDGGVAGSVVATTSWQVLDRAGLAMLDGQFAAAAARWPAVATGLIASAVHRSHARAVLLASVRARRAETRLLLLFWHLADRWGRVGRGGVVVPLALTHGRLAELVCLRRPTVTAALARLRDAGQLARRGDGTWLLAANSLEALAPQVPDRGAA